jgi:ABC-type lipoprotein export system ATPase subunit
MSALVQVNGVHKYFTRGSERIDVLKGVNLEIPKGDFLALMGPSGSGKTSLLNLMGGLDQPSAGSIDVGGTNIASLSGSQLSKWRSHHIGFVFQLYNLLPVLTAERNVDLPLLLTKLSKAERPSTTRASFRADRSSASALLAPLSRTPRCCSPTNRPATSIARPATKFLTCCRRSTATTARPSSW